jgi:hypothetical protein
MATSLVNDVWKRMKAHVHVVVAKQYAGGGLNCPRASPSFGPYLFQFIFLYCAELNRRVRASCSIWSPTIIERCEMRVSISFFFHLLGFGLVVTTLVAGLVLERKLRSEQDLRLKLYVGGLARTMGLLSPFAVLLLLITGIGNIVNRYAGTSVSWYQEGWLVAKIIFFVILLLNGMLYGPRISRNRTKLLKSLQEDSAPVGAEKGLASLNHQMTLFYLVQGLLLLIIVYLSLLGTGKPPGAF